MPHLQQRVAISNLADKFCITDVIRCAQECKGFIPRDRIGKFLFGSTFDVSLVIRIHNIFQKEEEEEEKEEEEEEEELEEEEEEEEEEENE